VSYRNPPAPLPAGPPATAAAASVATGSVGAARAGRPRDEGRERAILDAALALVAEEGYDRTTMDAVAARARASKATIYRRWPGKAELVIAAVLHLVGDPTPATLTGDLRADLLVLLQEMRTAMEGQVGDLMAGLAVAARRDPALAEALRTQFRDAKLCPKTATIVAEAVQRHQVPQAADSQLLDELLPALLLFRQIQGESTDDAYLGRVIDDVLLPLLRRTAVTDEPPADQPSPPRRPTPRSPRSRKEPRP
jgi:AcrR family transcriptional regulator